MCIRDRNYTITGLGEDDIIIESLAAGKTVVIDAKTGLVRCV